jgi:tRNA_anti-like
MRLSILIAVAIALGVLAQSGNPQSKKSKGPIRIQAEDLARECADRQKAEARYAGKRLRVTGTVGDIYDDILYLPVKVKGEEVLVGIRYDKGKKPAVQKGDTATFEGKFDRVAVLGPVLTECKLVSTGDKKK